LRLAARLGQSWVAVDRRGVDRALVDRLEEACAEVGRDPGSLDRIALLGLRERPLDSIQAFRDVVGHYRELGFTDLVVHWPEGPFTGSPALFETIAAEGWLA
jgi:hypothetical protein